MLIKVALISLALLRYSFADTCDNLTGSVSSSSDANAISSCSVFSHTVTIESSVVGALSFDGLTKLSGGGGLTCSNASQLTSVSSYSLQTLGDGASFTFKGADGLTSLEFQNLSSITGCFNLQDLPALQNLKMASGYDIIGAPPDCPGIDFVNTGLEVIVGVFGYSKPGPLNIYGNPKLTRVELLHTIDAGGGMSIINNGPYVSISIPHLSNPIGNVTFGNCSELYLPQLYEVTGNLTLENASFSSFRPQYLSHVYGSVRITGNFTGLLLPSLVAVRGDFYVQTSSEFDCTPFKALDSSGVIEGTFFCDGAAAGTSLSTSASGSRGPAPSLPTGGHTTLPSPAAIASVVVGAVIFVLVGLSSAAWLLVLKRRRRHRKSTTNPTTSTELGASASVQELPQGFHHERAELAAAPNHVSELHGDQGWRPREMIQATEVLEKDG